MSMTRTITNDFLHYLQHRQLNELINLFANDVKWEVPGDVDDIRWLGTRNSKLEIQDLFNTLWQETEPISSKVEKILYDVNDVIIKGVFTTKMLKTERVVTSAFFIHFKVFDYKIVEYTLLEDSYAVSQALVKN